MGAAENNGVFSEPNRTRERFETMMIRQLPHDDIRGQRDQVRHRSLLIQVSQLRAPRFV